MQKFSKDRRREVIKIRDTFGMHLIIAAIISDLVTRSRLTRI